MTYQTMCALRIYLRRGDLAKASGFWSRLFRTPLATELVHAALKAGITHASLTFGNMGFAKSAAQVATDLTEIPVSTLPVCVELVGPRPLLDKFVRDHAKQVHDATLVMLEGVHIRSMVAEGGPGAPEVEYIRVEDSPGIATDSPAGVEATLGSARPPVES